MGKINLLNKIAGYRGVKKRAGFTLIEVIVALGIFFIVLIALLGSYYSYYRNVQFERYKTIGENLAQLQLEDIQNLSVSVLVNLVKDNPDNTPPIGWSTTYTNPNYPGDTDSSPSVYDSGDGSVPHPLIDSSFRIEHLTNICGKIDGSLPSGSDKLILPGNIEVTPVLETDPDTGATYYDYTLTLNKETFPHYEKRIVITDETPLLGDSYKIFNIEVTVFWHDANGVEKSITVTGEKSYARSSL